MNRKKSVNVKKIRGKKDKSVIIVSTKVSKKATERNKIKRRIREIIRDRSQKTGQNYKIYVNPSAKNLSYQELEKEIKKQID